MVDVETDLQEALLLFCVAPQASVWSEGQPCRTPSTPAPPLPPSKRNGRALGSPSCPRKCRRALQKLVEGLKGTLGSGEVRGGFSVKAAFDL